MDIAQHLLLWRYANVKVLDIRYYQNEATHFHQLPANVFVFLHKGKAVFTAKNQQYEIVASHIIHQGQTQPLTLEVDENSAYYLIFYKSSFATSLHSSIARHLQFGNPLNEYYQQSITNTVDLQRTCHMLWTCWQCQEDMQKIRVKSLFYEFIYQLLTDMNSTTTQPPILAQQVKHFITTNFAQPLSLEFIASSLNYSTSHTSACFKKETGMSVMEYVTQIRLKYTKQLLTETNQTITQIAQTVGYQDVYYLSRLFKQHTSYTPSQYRKLQSVNCTKKSGQISMVDDTLSIYSKGDYEFREDLFVQHTTLKSLVTSFLLCFSLVLGGCSTATPKDKVQGTTSTQDDTTMVYTDSRGKKVDIPTNPQRIVMQGNAIGDLLALGIQPVGVDRRFIDTGILEMKEKVTAEDIGFPTSIEKVLDLKPDLIMLSYLMENEDVEASKIAPTVVFEGDAPFKERFLEIAKIVNKAEEGEKIFADYENSVDTMWENLYQDGTFKKGDTAVILQYFHNKSMYLAKTGGLAELVYGKNGLGMETYVDALKPNAGPYIEVSPELLQETLVGDHLFVLVTGDDEAKKEFEAFQQSPVWQSIDAIKNKKVIYIEDKWNYDDVTSGRILVEEFPKLIES